MLSSEYSFVLKPSSFGGVGVFAACDVEEGTHLFDYDFEVRTMKIKDVPPEFLRYCIYINDEECLCPERFNRMEIGWYINHSSEPNIGIKFSTSTSDPVKKLKEHAIYALKPIKAGEEVLIDYNYLEEPEHLKEDYFKASNKQFAIN